MLYNTLLYIITRLNNLVGNLEFHKVTEIKLLYEKILFHKEISEITL